MPKVTVHGHLPAFLTPSLNRAAQSPGAKLPHQAEAGTGSGALEANVKNINLGFFKLKIHRPSASEIALRERVQKVQAKSTPYASKLGASGVELNGQVQAKRSESSMLSSESVMCRHFAAMFMQRGGKKSDVMQTFSTEAGIAEKFDGKLAEIEVGLNKALKEAPAGCKHLVNSEQLGGYLKAMAMQIQAPGAGEGPCEANCLFHTADHAMALHVERKRKDGVEYFSAKLYDPNETATYKRVVKANPEDFVSLRLKDMMIRPELISLYTNGANKPLSMVAVSLDHRLQPPMDRSSTTASAESMFLALQSGLLDDVRSMLKTALEGTQVSNESKELLRAHHLWDELVAVPGLYMAFQNDQSDVVKAFTEAVLASDGLNEQEKVNLLAAKTDDGRPGLFSALKNGHSDAVKVFACAVLASNLKPQAKVELLAAKDRQGITGLEIADLKRLDETASAFAQILRRSRLDEAQMDELLSPLNSSPVH